MMHDPIPPIFAGGGLWIASEMDLSILNITWNDQPRRDQSSKWISSSYKL
jgi:hypothetical protein